MKKNIWPTIILTLVVVGLLLFWYFKIRPKTENIIQINPSPVFSDVLTPSPLLNPNEITIKLFMIASDDNGKNGKLIGCNDSVVAVEKQIPLTEEVLKTTLTELLNIKTQIYGKAGYENALANSNLALDSTSIESSKATIKLSGNLQIAGTCEAPRIKAQLEETALQFPTIKEVLILIDNKPLDEILSQKGE